MTSQTLSPDTDPRLIIEGETTDLTRYNAAPKPSPLPRPEAETAVIRLPDMPPREFVLLADGRDTPAYTPRSADMERIMRSGEYPTLRPAALLGTYAERRSVPYVRSGPRRAGGRHRRPSLLARLLGGAR